MSAFLRVAFSTHFIHGYPAWAEPFLQAVSQLEAIDEHYHRQALDVNDVRTPHAVAGAALPAVPEETRALKMEEAEVNLHEAIRSSEGRQVLPYTWLSALLEQRERWLEALEATGKALALDPWSPSLLFRLSRCYEHEHQYTTAYLTYNLGTCLLPTSERPPHHAKLARLKEQSDDMEAHVVRKDPFEVLPPEVITRIMQFGLKSPDRHFVLRCSWVDHRWRTVLVTQSPVLWGNLTFDFDELKDTHFEVAEEKRQAWIQRAGSKIHTVTFQRMHISSPARIHKNYASLFERAGTLNVSAVSPLALSRLWERFRATFHRLHHLKIDGGYEVSSFREPHYRAGDPSDQIHCHFPAFAQTTYLKSIELSKVDFQIREGHQGTLPRLWDYDTKFGDSYPALKRLTVDRCSFMNAYLLPELPSSVQAVWQSDPLHRALRKAERLEYLKVVPEAKTSWQAAKPWMGSRITLEHLKTAIIGPPSVWSIDICAPNLETLIIVLPEDDPWAKRHFVNNDDPLVVPLIPDLEHSPVTIDTIWRLRKVKFEASFNDLIPRLEEWLLRLTYVRTFEFCGMDRPYPNRSAPAERPDNRAQIRILQSLVDHPEWCPVLEDLRLSFCYTPGDQLLQLIAEREGATGAAARPLRRLHLRHCSKLSDITRAQLNLKVPSFSSTDEVRDPAEVMR